MGSSRFKRPKSRSWSRVSLLQFGGIGLAGFWLGGQAWAQCSLSTGQGIQDVGNTVCSTNSAYIYTYQGSGQHEGLTYGGAVDTATSVFIWPRVSLHYKGYLKEEATENGRDLADERVSVRSTDQAFVHFGHSITDPIQFSVGQIPLPFGLRMERYRYQLPHRTDYFWDRTVSGGRIFWRARTDLHLEAGISPKKTEQFDKKDFRSYTLRATKHFDLLNGAKLIGSYQNHGGRRVGKMGVAALVFFNDDISSLEWVRNAENWRTNTYQQLFRFMHVLNVDDYQWSIEYDDLRRDSSRLVVGFNREFAKDLRFGGAIQYEKLRPEPSEDSWLALITLSYATTLQSQILR